MFRYSGFALAIHSEVELPDLPVGDGAPDVVIRYGPVGRLGHKASMREEVALNTAAGGFHIKNGREIVLDPFAGVDPDVLRVLLLGRMMAYLLRQRGWLPLHASGVSIDGQVVLFLGASGAGKSTTAAAFHSRGHQVVTDDVGAVRVARNRCLVCPAGPRIRLLEDSRAVFDSPEPRGSFQWDKHTFNLAGGDLPDALPVARIYVPGFGIELKSEFIPAMSAIPLLSAHSFVKRGRMDREALKNHLRDCSAVASTVPVYHLIRRRSLRDLPELVRWVEEDVARNG